MKDRYTARFIVGCAISNKQISIGEQYVCSVWKDGKLLIYFSCLLAFSLSANLLICYTNAKASENEKPNIDKDIFGKKQKLQLVPFRVHEHWTSPTDS